MGAGWCAGRRRRDFSELARPNGDMEIFPASEILRVVAENTVLGEGGGNNNGQLLEWNVRLDIAAEVAEGLKYIWDKNIVHRDIKSSNVLLDHGFHAKLSDFGMSMQLNTHTSSEELGIREGTAGYCPPETSVSLGTDVYSFGVLLLELVTGQKAYDDRRPFGFELAKWAEPVVGQAGQNNDFSRIVDGRLGERYTNEGMKRACAISRFCTVDNPITRRRRWPELSEAVKCLRAECRFEG